jgi:magnesium-protoporphyrin O-methyltransferase
MNCCQCQGIETCFNEKRVGKELARYRKKGPAKTTRMLIDAVKAEGVQGVALLDIGGGVGAIQHELLKAGAGRATSVEASSSYLEASKAEATQQGHADRVSYHHGDFVALASDIPPADIVTLDRVICCYPDMQSLVELSSARAGKLYALVYPRDTWWVKIGIALGNLALRATRNPFRTFVHPTQAVEALVRRNGLKPRFYSQTAVWQVALYARP